MSQLKEVKELCDKMQFQLEVFGTEAGVEQTVHEKLGAIGQTLMQEKGLGPEQAKAMPENTELPPKAQALFDDLRQWWKQLPGTGV